MTVLKAMNIFENLTVGQTISFTESCNADATIITGTVEYKEQLGYVTIVNCKQYELRKVIFI